MPDVSTELTPFEGLDVIRSAIEIPGAAGGLRDALKVQPMEAHRGERVFLVLEVEVGKIRYEPAKVDDGEEDAWTRVHVMDTQGVAIVDEELVRDALDTMAARIAEAKAIAKREAEDAAGIVKLSGIDDGCPFPGCTLPEEHEGEHQLATNTVLGQLKKPELIALCEAHQLVPGKTSTGPKLVKLLLTVPGIEVEAQAVLDARAPAQADNVTELHPEADNG